MDVIQLVRRIAPVGGPLVAVGVAAATSTLRGNVGSANVGVALAAVVVGAALLGRIAGILTALTAALAFNYFHTEPYGSLRINSAGDAAFVALLAVLGFVVGDVRSWQRERAADRWIESAHDSAASRVQDVLSHELSAIETWHAAIDAAGASLRLVECRFVPGQPRQLPLVSARGERDSSRVVLPQGGALVAVRSSGVVVGHLELLPHPDVAPLELDRQPLLALGDAVGLALSPTREAARRWNAAGARD